MKLHRFFGNFDLSTERIVVSDKELLSQWQNVLRFELGDELMLCDGTMNEALGRIISLKKNSAEIEVLGVSKNERELDGSIILYCAILKGEHFELVVEKATELGVAEIVPILCERTVKQHVRRERLEKIIREAAEQSGRGVVPRLGETKTFSEAVQDAKANEANFFFDESGKDITVTPDMTYLRVGIFVGPEGGWTENEINEASGAKFDFVSLGKTILRAETAAVVAVHAVAKALY